MPALAGVRKRAVLIPFKVNAAGHEVVYNLPRAFKHTVHRGGVVFVVTRTHSVLEIFGVIVVAAQSANAALRKIAVALARRLFTDYEHRFIAREIERTVEPRHPDADYYYVVFFLKDCHYDLPLIIKCI